MSPTEVTKAPSSKFFHGDISLQLLAVAFLSKAVTRLKIFPPSLQKGAESNGAFTKPGRSTSPATGQAGTRAVHQLQRIGVRSLRLARGFHTAAAAQCSKAVVFGETPAIKSFDFPGSFLGTLRKSSNAAVRSETASRLSLKCKLFPRKHLLKLSLGQNSYLETHR